MLSDSAARALLVLHTLVGMAAVAVTTHLVIWLRRYVRGAAGRRPVVRFAVIGCALQGIALLAGTAMYPSYRVEVRLAYLENSREVARELEARAKVAPLSQLEAPATAAMVERAAHAVRWFEIKEHWVAIGCVCAAAVLLVLAFWRPDRDGTVIAPFVVGLAVISAASTWLAAIIGVLTAAWRAV